MEKNMNAFISLHLTSALGMLKAKLVHSQRLNTKQAETTGPQKSRTRMEKKTPGQTLLAGLPLSGSDAARLVLEALEEMPELRQLAAQGKDALMQALRRVLHEGIAAVRAQERTVSFSHAAQESLARRTMAGRRPTTLRDLRHFIRRLLRLPGLAERPLRAMDTQECRRALEQAFAGSAHSFRKGRAILHSIFAYGMRQGWCSDNPVAAIEHPVLKEREIVPLPLRACRKLVAVAKTPCFRDCLPALSLMLFAGVRPGEVARLRWADVRCDEGALCIAARHCKTGGARRVELSPALQRLLRRLRAASNSRLCPPQWSRRWQQLRRAAGFTTGWVPDILRHTFASYHALTHRNLPALQLQLGHRDSRLLFTRYLNLPAVRRSDLGDFWRLAG